MIFVGGNVVKTITEEDILGTCKDDRTEFSVGVFRRVTVNSIATLISALQDPKNSGITFVLNISGELLMPQGFNIPASMGVEFAGVVGSQQKPKLGFAERVNIFAEGANIFGRAVFKDIVIDLQNGVLSIQGPVIFQSCDIINTERCPARFQEFGALCVRASPFLEPAQDSNRVCSDLGGFWMDEADLTDPTGIGENLLDPGDEVWIRPAAGSSSCALALDSSGNLQQGLDQADCEGYKRVLCAVPVKESIVGRRYTSYLTDQTIPNAVSDLVWMDGRRFSLYDVFNLSYS